MGNGKDIKEREEGEIKIYLDKDNKMGAGH